MNFSVTISADTLDDLASRLYVAADALTAAGNAPGEAVDKPKATPKAVDKPKAAPKAEPKPADDDDGLDYDTDVAPLIAALSNAHGKPAAREVLAMFTNPETDEPATKAPQIAKADWPELVKQTKAAHRKLDKAKAAAEADED